MNQIVEHLEQIRRLAWGFHVTTGLDPEDLYGEACLEVVKYFHRYDESQGKLSTFLMMLAINRLKNYTNRKNGNRQIKEDYIDYNTPDLSMMFLEKLKHEKDCISNIFYNIDEPYCFICIFSKGL